MAKDKKISQVSITDKISGDELIPFSKNGDNGAVSTGKILEKAKDDAAVLFAPKKSVDNLEKRVDDVERAQTEDLAKITELSGKLNGVENLSDELSKIPTLQEGSKGDEKNYIYSDPTIQGKGAIAAARYRPKENGRLAAQYKYWGDTDFNYNTEFPQATVTTDGVMSASDKSNLEGIIEKIPSQASAENQLADKDFVNSSIATNTAEFKGTHNSLEELQIIAADANDYGFVVSKDSDGNTVYNRYKYVEGQGWVFEYALNNSSFTAAQWAAIQSGITSGDVAKIKEIDKELDTLGFTVETLNTGLGEANARIENLEGEKIYVESKNILKFDGLISEDYKCEQVGYAGSEGKVCYSLKYNAFVLVVGTIGAKYYSAWPDSEDYGKFTTSGITPKANCIYICTSDNSTYSYDGTLLVRNVVDMSGKSDIYIDGNNVGGYVNPRAVRLVAGLTYFVENNSDSVVEFIDVAGKCLSIPKRFSQEVCFATDIVSITNVYKGSVSVTFVGDRRNHLVGQTCGFVQELYISDPSHSKYELEIDTVNYWVRLHGDGSALTSYVGFKSTGNLSPLALESFGYIVLDKNVMPMLEGNRVKLEVVNFSLENNPIIANYLEHRSLEKQEADLSLRIDRKLEAKAGKNLFDGTLYDGSGIGSGGSVVTNAAWQGSYALTDYIPFGDAEALTCNFCAYGVGFKHALYDKDFNRVAIEDITSAVSTVHRTVDNAVYARFSVSLKNNASQRQIERGEKFTEYEPYSPIAGYLSSSAPSQNNSGTVKFTEITCNSDPESNADFKGNDAIQQAIDSITDASESNQYILKCTGHFIFSKISDYRYSKGTAAWYGINGKSFVHLDGLTPGNCVIRGELPETLSDVVKDIPSNADYSFDKSSYGWVIAIQWNCNSWMKNVTAVARNIRYPVHTDGSEYGCENFETKFECCRFEHEGKFGDSVGTTGVSASGFGTSSGQKLVFENVNFNTSHYCHTNKNFHAGSVAVWRNCNFFAAKHTITTGIGLVAMNSKLKSRYVFENCKFLRNSFVAVSPSFFITENPKADDVIDIEMIATDMVPMPMYSNSIITVLRIVSNSTGTTSTVRFKPSSAFDILVGDSSETAAFEDKWFATHISGYSYKDGGVGLSGYAQGCRLITEREIRSLKVSALGVRLGDCTSSHKELIVEIDGTEYNIVFDKNYTEMSNAQILEYINSVIGHVATASEYNIAMDYYPEFGYIEVALNSDSSAILRGMGVVFDNTGIRRALASDGRIDGIAICDSAPGCKCKFITQGYLNLDSLSNFVIRRKDKDRYYNMSEQREWGIAEDEPGVFDKDAEPKLVRKAFNDSCMIIR